jgi:intein/homing endonuclease
LYLHTTPVDGGINLIQACKDLGLNPTRDVIFPINYSPAQGFPETMLNQLYNCGDLFLTTHLGEGWGLCLDPETFISTSVGASKIKDIVPGDKVIGQDGKFHKVIERTQKNVDEIYKVKTAYSPDILVTPEHPFYIKRNGAEAAEWLNVKDIRKGDFLALPKYRGDAEDFGEIDLLDFYPAVAEHDLDFVWLKMGFSPRASELSISAIQKKYQVSKRVAEDARRVILGSSLPSRGLLGSKAKTIADKILEDSTGTGSVVNENLLKIRRKVKINDEFLYFLGWYLAEGSNERGNRIELDFHIKEWHFAMRLSEYLNDTFAVKSLVVKNGKNKCSLRLSGNILSEVLGVICGVHAWNKKIPDFLFKNPYALGALVSGLFQGDGHLGCKNRRYTLTTTSPSLAFQVRNICSALSILCGIKEYPPRGAGRHAQFVCVPVASHLHRFQSFIGRNLDMQPIKRKSAVHHREDDNFFYVKVHAITKIESKNHLVFDIGVENSHSFLANGILAHNTVHEAMAAGVPVVAPNNTNMPEMLGDSSLKVNKRGFLYECRERIWVDNSGYRPMGRVEDICLQMMAAYHMIKRSPAQLITAARDWAVQHDWKVVGREWVKLFESRNIDEALPIKLAEMAIPTQLI